PGDNALTQFVAVGQDDLFPNAGCHAYCQFPNGDFFSGANVVDTHMLTKVTNNHEALDKIINVAEASSFVCITQNLEDLLSTVHCFKLSFEIRDDVTLMHPRPIDVERPDDGQPVKQPTVKAHHFTDYLTR